MTAAVYPDVKTPQSIEGMALTITFRPEMAVAFKADWSQFAPNGTGGWTWNDSYPDSGVLTGHAWWPEPHFGNFQAIFRHHYLAMWHRLVFTNATSGQSVVTAYPGNGSRYGFEADFILTPLPCEFVGMHRRRAFHKAGRWPDPSDVGNGRQCPDAPGQNRIAADLRETSAGECP